MNPKKNMLKNDERSKIREFLPNGNGEYRQRNHQIHISDGRKITLKMPTEEELLGIRHTILDEVKRQNGNEQEL